MPDNLSQKVEAAAENAYVKLVARLALPAIAFVGLSAWNDLKSQGEVLQQVLRNQAVAKQKIGGVEKRLDNLEEWQKQITYKGTTP